MNLPLFKQPSEVLEHLFVLQNVQSGLLCLYLHVHVLSDIGYYCDFIVNFSHNIPVLLLEVLTQVLTHIINATLEPELIYHAHLVANVQLPL
jgi:hypothetical protein